MEALAFLIILALAGYGLHLRSRLLALEQTVEALRLTAIPPLEWQRLTARVRALEHTEPVVVPEPVAQPLPEPEESPEAEDVQVLEPPPLPAAHPEASATPPPPALPGPTFRDRLRRVLGDEEWESLVGGSLLNKLGALILVIGIALFLGFSFSRMTAGGRSGIAGLVSLAALGAGVGIERRERYRVFARGLIGAGWAGLYATAYAAWALPAARVIEDPFTGSLTMLLVAAGMIWHALRYRSQAMTSVAYFAAFAALAATPSSPFAVLSLIPLAGSSLWLSARYNWYSMPLFGLAATYLTCISRGDSGAPLSQTQPLFLTFWLLFDAFDLLRTRRRILTGGVEWIYLVNFVAFTGLSYLAWSRHAPEQLWIAAAGGALLFLADALARAFLRPPSTFAAEDDLGQRLRAGSYEVSVFLSAVLAGLAIVARVPGIWMSAGLALEAEILYLAGVQLELPFLRRMGGAAFVHSLLRIGWDIAPGDKSNVLGHEIQNWTPPALLHTALFYLNRALRQPNFVMSSAAMLLVAAVIGLEVPAAYAGCAWISYGYILLEAGLRPGRTEFRLQAYALLAGGVLATATRSEWIPLALSLAVVYGCALRTRRVALAGSGAAALLAWLLIWHAAPGEYVALTECGLALFLLELGTRRWPAELRRFFLPAGGGAFLALVATEAHSFAKFPPSHAVWISVFGAAVIAWLAAVRAWNNPIERDPSALAGTAALLAATWLVVPDPRVTFLWTAIALAVLEIASRFSAPDLRYLSLGAFAVIYYRLFSYDLDAARLPGMPFAIAGLYWLWRHSRHEPAEARIILWTAVIPLLALIAQQSGATNTAPGWMAVSLVLFFLAHRFTLPDLRLQSGLIALMAFGAAMLHDVDPPHLWISSATVLALYTGHYLARRTNDNRARMAFPILGTLLLCALLHGRVSGSLLTVSWGLEGLALLTAGFIARERILRLQGLALLLLCILKLFVYDLRNLETLYRILSFVALGLILLAVSWIYTRFREHIRRLL